MSVNTINEISDTVNQAKLRKCVIWLLSNRLATRMNMLQDLQKQLTAKDPQSTGILSIEEFATVMKGFNLIKEDL